MNAETFSQMVGQSVGRSLESVSKVDQAGQPGTVGRAVQSVRRLIQKRRAVGEFDRHIVCLFVYLLSIQTHS